MLDAGGGKLKLRVVAAVVAVLLGFDIISM